METTMKKEVVVVAAAEQTLEEAVPVKKKEMVVMYPAVGAGHFLPMMELAERGLLPHGFSVAVVIPEGSIIGVTSTDTIISRLSAAHPDISFHRLPTDSLPGIDPAGNPVANFLELIRLASPFFRDLLVSLSEAFTVRALLLDLFCTDALEVADELSIPAHFFFCTGASILAAFLHLPTLPFPDLAALRAVGDDVIPFPGLPPVPASSLPDVLLEHGEFCFKRLLYHFDRLPLGESIVVNTFRELEERAVTAVTGGLSVPGRRMPPVYCVGPLMAKADEKHECLSWLDTQPRRSVVFLCFGSMFAVSAEQLKEIAAGLERSGQRFIWMVRNPAAGGEKTEPDLDALLPEGFLSRTAERGLVVKTWAPQVAVLGHGAVGGFVTHCGWNSAMEGICAGVPLIAWPMYAEQRMVKVFLTELGVATEMRGHETGMVAAEEVEEKVRWLMESEEGRKLGERAVEFKEKAATALADGGSSQAALMTWVADLKGENGNENENGFV